MKEIHESQMIYRGDGTASALDSILQECKAKKVLLVCGKSFFSLPIAQAIKSSSVSFTIFQDFSPNPKYEDIVLGVEAYKRYGCDTILAVGGGSALDVAKCIKLFVPMQKELPYHAQPLADSKIMLIAIPTTAGTGSESTQFAVIYVNGEKASLSHPSILPDYALLDPSVLQTLPIYQKKCSMLDALCQALESWWSVESSPRSIAYSKRAIKRWLASKEGYLANTEEGNQGMLEASNLAGRAINLTKTTAPHAMSYKMTSLFGFPHGHAVALAFPYVWRYMLHHPQSCIDKRGADYVLNVFVEMAKSIGQSTAEQAIEWFISLLAELEISSPEQVSEAEFEILRNSVNIERLKNNPMQLDSEALMALYKEILK
jgi:alcohol dehydrogenase class IV